jgi:hypothetical protein
MRERTKGEILLKILVMDHHQQIQSPFKKKTPSNRNEEKKKKDVLVNGHQRAPLHDKNTISGLFFLDQSGVPRRMPVLTSLACYWEVKASGV